MPDRKGQAFGELAKRGAALHRCLVAVAGAWAHLDLNSVNS
jgi:hypothetical protein